MSKRNNDFFNDQFDSYYGGSGIGTHTTGGKVQYVSCYTTHPVLKIGKGTVYGGSCSSPTTDQADIYIGFDSFMKRQKNHYPWDQDKTSGPTEILFKIDDQHAPSDTPGFIKMIDWCAARLEEGKTLHAGCMGGHGRTGLFLAALVAVVTGNSDSITWVRENYCKKAVETQEQIRFLNKHFGIKEVEGSKSHAMFSPTKGKKQAQSSTRKYHQDKQGKLPMPMGNDDFIPGTSILRAKGPRDLLPPKNLKVRYLPSGNLQSIWTRLTNAKTTVSI